MTGIHVRPLFGSASDREKDEQRRQLEADVVQFLAQGGKIKRLGNDPINKKSISRRQVVEGGIDGRSTRRRKKA